MVALFVVIALTRSSLQKPEVPPEGALLGLWIRPDDGVALADVWDEREQDAGRTYDIAHTFHPFDEDFPGADERLHVDAGRIVLLSWNGGPSGEIASGDHDELIRDRARAVADLGVPVFLRYFWEMDGERKSDLAESPEKYRAAWVRIHEIFEDEGATNAAFVWCPNAWQFDERDTKAWYPGDDVVDWVCADGYDWGPDDAGADNEDTASEDFGAVFGDFLTWAQTTGKPVMIAEFGAAEGGRGAKADWLDDAATTISEDYPGIKAVVYFDEDATVTHGHRDWRLGTSEESYASWNEIASNPYFNTRGG